MIPMLGKSHAVRTTARTRGADAPTAAECDTARHSATHRRTVPLGATRIASHVDSSTITAAAIERAWASRQLYSSDHRRDQSDTALLLSVAAPRAPVTAAARSQRIGVSRDNGRTCTAPTPCVVPTRRSTSAKALVNQLRRRSASERECRTCSRASQCVNARECVVMCWRSIARPIRTIYACQ